MQFRITNINCDACVKLSVMALEKVPGVSQAVVDQATGAVSLTADRAVPWDEITAALQTVGKTASQQPASL